jgi:hypothetical protein
VVHPRSNVRVGACGGRIVLNLRYSGLENGKLASVIGEVAHATVFGCDIGDAAGGERGGSRGDLMLILGGGPERRRKPLAGRREAAGAGGEMKVRRAPTGRENGGRGGMNTGTGGGMAGWTTHHWFIKEALSSALERAG